MNTSLSFDRAASFYDSTRDLPEPVSSLGIQAILDVAGPEASMLDVGTGTGRISVPLLNRGARLIGCDLSQKMMAVLRKKIPAAKLAEADASLLPFPADHFDALITCHVMHLVGPWRAALREYRRVLRPGGVYINARTEHAREESVERRLTRFWESRVEAHGASSKRPGIQNEKELHAALLGMGASVEQVPVVRFSRSRSVREVIDGIASRTHWHTWGIPEDILTVTVRELREWAAQEFKDSNLIFEEESEFILDIARFARITS
jgi:SAM-dependent methyltransferase